MRAILAGGGTGGHVIPALAIANQLKKSYDAEVLFIGTARGIENRLVPAAGFPLQLVRVGALKNVSLTTRAEDCFRSAARRLGCRPHAQRVRSRRGDRRRRIRFRPGDAGGRHQAHSHAGLRAQRGAGICQSNGRAFCFGRRRALRRDREIFSSRRSHGRSSAAGLFRNPAQARRDSDAAGLRRQPGRARHQRRHDPLPAGSAARSARDSHHSPDRRA